MGDDNYGSVQLEFASDHVTIVRKLGRARWQTMSEALIISLRLNPEL
jgi:hypothetical protein